MKNILLYFALVVTFQINAQDTTWVQTFTYDSISTRRANFDFPQDLNSKRFEKVLMYYKLKCDPLTPWDQYNCGEWDYLAYTRIFDHTGAYDSVRVDSVQFMADFNSPANYSYVPLVDTKYDSYIRVEQERSSPATITSQILPIDPFSPQAAPFDVTKKGGRLQMLITASELNLAGITAGDLQSLSLFIPTGGISGGGELFYPSISLKATNDIALTAYHTSGFTEVYNRTLSAPYGSAELIEGENELLFHTPFTWNGTDNIIIEFHYENPQLPANTILFESEGNIVPQALNYEGRNGVLEFDGSNHAMMELSDVDLGSGVTISFWAKGLGNTGVNTSILEAEDTLNDRTINIHMPWSDNTLYWDCGAGSGYDRINQGMSGAGIDNEWHHWAFIKDQSTGVMKIMRDGVLWHSGSGLTKMVGYMNRMILGANKDLGNHWTGMIDEFQIFNAALDESTVATWYTQKADAGHPNWANLLAYYNFDDDLWAQDQSQNSYLLMPSELGMINFDEYPVAGIDMAQRPSVAFGQGTVSGASGDVEVPWITAKEPEVVFEFAPVNQHFEIVDAFLAFPEGTEDSYDANGALIGSAAFSGTASLTNTEITYYEVPFEVVNDIEIGRFITPYGIQFDLGPNGFTWIYDVTDYQMYLKNTVDLAAHNTQELIDLKFAFIEGIPPRDVHARQPIWSEWRSYSYNAMDSDAELMAVPVLLSDTSEMFKIKTRFTGHGHNGNNNCCEWGFGAGRDHEILIDGVSRFNWEIWEETACGDNPNVSQGGTWPYAREGWCPGDLVREYDHELTPFVASGTTVSIDYDITDIPVSDPDQGNGNYVVAMDLISYGSPNHQYDAAIVDIYNPNSWEYYGKWNPSCQNPRVIIQNTGEQALTSCRITVWVDWGHQVEFDWTGNLQFLEKEVVEIPIIDNYFWYDYSSSGTFTAHVNYVNQSWTLDEYPNNNELTVPFEAPDFVDGPFLVWFTTNNKANENKWRLEDSYGNVVFERTTLTNSTVYKDTFDLAPGCYSIILEDSDNDGISFWYSQQVEGETAGSFRLKKVGGGFIETFESDFGNFHRYNFSVGFGDLGNIELPEMEEEILIYPNPNDGVFDIEISGNIDNKAQLKIYDIMGRLVYDGNMIAKADFAYSKLDLAKIPAGHFIVKIQTPNGVYTDEFVKN